MHGHHGDTLHMWRDKLTQASHSTDEILDKCTWEQPLRRGQKLVSRNRYYVLWFRNNGNLELYKKYFENADNLIWETDTRDCDATVLTFKKNGKLVLRNDYKETAWSSHCELGKAVADRDQLKLKLTNYGSLVASNGDDMVFWCSNTSSKLKTKFFFAHQIHEGTTMYQDQVLMSKNMARRLTIQRDGNLVIYDCRDYAIWNSETNGQGEGPYKLRMQDDGNMVLYDGGDNCLWSSETMDQGEGKRKAKLTNDGQFKVVDSEGNELWSNNVELAEYEKEDAPNYQDRLCGQNGTYQSMMPGSFLRSTDGEYALKFGRDCNLEVVNVDGDRLWGTELEGLNDNAFLCVQNDGNMVIYTKESHESLWSTETCQEGLCDQRVRLIMQEDGNLVLYDPDCNALWASNDQ